MDPSLVAREYAALELDEEQTLLAAVVFPDGSFDVVTCNHMLYHVGDIDAVPFTAKRRKCVYVADAA